MSAMTIISCSVDDIGKAERLVIMHLRCWAGSRAAGDLVLPVLVAMADELGIAGQVAVALDSMFSLTEACLGRALAVESGDSRRLGADELAVLALLDQGRHISGAHTPHPIPHGLPGVLAWATVAVRQGFARNGLAMAGMPFTPPGHCPFGETRPA